jgi:hypothetical protein
VGLITPLKSHRFVWCSSWGDWAVIKGEDTEAGSEFDSVNMDGHDVLGISTDGLEVSFLDTNPDAEIKSASLFSLKQRSVLMGAPADPSFRSWKGAYIRIPGLVQQGWQLDRKPLQRDGNDVIYSTDFSQKAIYLGGSRDVYAFDRQGNRLWKSNGLGSNVVLLRATNNGQLLLACLKDGTFRWLSTATGELKLSAFISGDRKK